MCVCVCAPYLHPICTENARSWPLMAVNDGNKNKMLAKHAREHRGHHRNAPNIDERLLINTHYILSSTNIHIYAELMGSETISTTRIQLDCVGLALVLKQFILCRFPHFRLSRAVGADGYVTRGRLVRASSVLQRYHCSRPAADNTAQHKQKKMSSYRIKMTEITIS